MKMKCQKHYLFVPSVQLQVDFHLNKKYDEFNECLFCSISIVKSGWSWLVEERWVFFELKNWPIKSDGWKKSKCVFGPACSLVCIILEVDKLREICRIRNDNTVWVCRSSDWHWIYVSSVTCLEFHARHFTRRICLSIKNSLIII